MRFIELDPAGPDIQIQVKTQPDARCRFTNEGNNVFTAFRGHGHILENPIEELPELSIRIPQNTLKYNLDAEELEELFVTDQISGGRERQQYEKLITDTGTIVKVNKAPTRRLRLRRNR
jgi:hypothetical protein